MKRILSVILCVVLLISIVPIVSAEGTSCALTTEDKLTAKGTSLVNQSGGEVVLKGTNLGGWLVYEGWMGSGDCADNTELWGTLEKRFGEERAKTLIDAYESNYITENDLDIIADMGLNCVRVPFWYRNFQNKNGEWLLKDNGEIDFSRLDWIVSECAKRGIYVILDMHGAPGGQSISYHTGEVASCHLYDDTAAGEQYRAETAILWKELAKHFKDAPNIAGYDLLNEPTCDMNTADYLYKLWSVYDELYKAVRSVDKNTVAIFEGIWELNMLPAPTLYKWENVMYEVHFYNYTEESVDTVFNNLLSYRDYYNVPVYIGEFNYGEVYKYALDKTCENDINFTGWSYKGITSENDTTWFLYTGTSANADVKTDSYEEILLKWGIGARTECFRANNDMIALYTAAAAATPDGNVADNSGSASSVLYNVYFSIVSIIKAVMSIFHR